MVNGRVDDSPRSRSCPLLSRLGFGGGGGGWGGGGWGGGGLGFGVYRVCCLGGLFFWVQGFGRKGGGVCVC